MEKINVSIRPKKFPIYSVFDDGEDIFVKIENKSSQPKVVDVEIRFPKEVKYRIDEKTMKEKGTGKLKTSFSIPAQKQNVFFITTKYIGKEKRKKDTVNMRFNTDEQEIKKVINAELIST